MPSTDPKFGLRPMLPADVAALRDIFSASVEGLTGDNYSIEQQEAWLTAVDDEGAFAERLADELVLVATQEGTPVGFASLRGRDEIDFLYVHPAVARQGAATKLVDALEKLAGGRGATTLTTDASDTAQAFFAARGYVAQHRNTVLLGDEWLSNTTMTKQLTGGGGAGAANENRRQES
jgi:putative acetyltransferase